ncbi:MULTISPECIES: hypothetical protein [unclassified Mesorhizobium]|uniref:hypothetical protein n=1 Tax=unclassified Mesorhizobium TaxID=325217 RepID=UPI000F758429|nr:MULTISPECIES: hypothetical protein [unclassified Mesorhizobium]AZO04296.1 hypothetical protein EJ068_15390 [Mesorhizobium sp. M2A.F.Ca.ET.043.02.1.1]RUW35821.1 hypothetical protein EOA37_27580 [Mesorhizobium sp. M2A.F.Ca.ET.015.02.1.1]RUW76843.1 hypothetical protein EOA28_13020 [Mesorhizobium sp. M2A.F.Ca.ET.067.02.1.1]RVC92542.1 hypothetical protein EN739_25165 [Mesorhizobium sp. M2A.F.Ca.ET.017.03.2.1]RVD11176.1 hypothetical protein EN753_03520 [Mesorhizobium sp. M2A.F.Ca.ET.029.05.1.1]
MQRRLVRHITAANKIRAGSNAPDQLKQNFREGGGGDYVAAEDRTSMFCSVKYNSMNCFTLCSVCKQNKGDGFEGHGFKRQTGLEHSRKVRATPFTVSVLEIGAKAGDWPKPPEPRHSWAEQPRSGVAETLESMP